MQNMIQNINNSKISGAQNHNDSEVKKSKRSVSQYNENEVMHSRKSLEKSKDN